MRAGALMKKLISERGANQKEVSEFADVAESTISRFLAGKLRLREKNLKNLLKYLKPSKDEELEIWKAWTLDGGEEKAAAYFEKLDQENKKLKKILKSLKEL